MVEVNKLCETNEYDIGKIIGSIDISYYTAPEMSVGWERIGRKWSIYNK